MDKKINRYFCVQPFVNTTTRIKGQNNVCCNMTKEDSNISHETPVDFFNSASVKKMRENLLAGIKLEECQLCYYQEKISKNSHRIEYNKYYNIKDNQTNEYYDKIVQKLRFANLKNPLYAELHISNLCNLKCLSCKELDSSRFHSENKKLGVSQDLETNYSKIDYTKYNALDSVIKKGLLFLDVRGGETLMVPEVKKILHQVDIETARNITLKIQTNGTIVPDHAWLDIMKKFKRTKLNVSVDAFDSDNYYVRFPANWQKIKETISCLKENNIKFIINTVVSNLNIMVLDKLFNWIQENGYLNYFYILRTPKHYQPTNLPQSLLDIAGERLQNVKREFLNKDCNQKLEDLIKMCKTSDQTHWQSFCKEITMRDKFRKNKITDVIPEIKQSLESYKISLNNRKENYAKVQRDQ